MTSTSTAESVNVTSRHPVLCANEASWSGLDSPFLLGPFDHLSVPGIPIAVVFIYERPTSTPDVELIPVERLQYALMRLLDYYPHLTGRLQINPNDGTPEIARLGSGAELLVAQCHERLDAFYSTGDVSPRRVLMSGLPAAGNALFAPFDSTLEGVCRDPILTLQHTRFACGSVGLGVRIHHIVCDADGIFQLVRDLAEVYRGLLSSEVNQDSKNAVPSLAHPPVIKSYMSGLSGEPIPTIESEHGAAVDTPSSSSEAPSFAPPPSPIAGRIWRVSSRELNVLKALATDPNGGSPSDTWISTFDALSAHLYQRVYRARLKLRTKDTTLGDTSPPDFLTPLNLRTRIGLPARYIPNALFCSYTSLPLDVLANGPLWQVAKALHEMMRAVSTTPKEEIDQTLRWIAAQPDKRKIKQGFRYGNGSLMVSQWNKFDMYAGTVFEVAPVLVSTPFTPISLLDGLAYFLPTEEQVTGGDAGAIDVHLSLSEALWSIMDQDEPIIPQ